ncbi:hypothetical protein [Mobilibacterium timonense]|uniref:hypothetical protein n=1 Tax=Mobilibacterium timonense TaxID=1871012 RepID=UPI0009FB4ED2|nr:hypothetical protein [Mobilibacterium timonense]
MKTYKAIFDKKSYDELKKIDWEPAGNIVDFDDSENAVIITDIEIFQAYLAWLSAEKGMNDKGEVNQYGIILENIYDEFLETVLVEL